MFFSIQLCVWSTDLWERQASKFLPVPPGRGSASLSDTRVQFHLDQTHLLAVHESQIAIYEAPKLECLKQVSKMYTMFEEIRFCTFLWLSHLL